MTNSQAEILAMAQPPSNSANGLAGMWFGCDNGDQMVVMAESGSLLNSEQYSYGGIECYSQIGMLEILEVFEYFEQEHYLRSVVHTDTKTALKWIGERCCSNWPLEERNLTLL